MTSSFYIVITPPHDALHRCCFAPVWQFLEHEGGDTLMVVVNRPHPPRDVDHHGSFVAADHKAMLDGVIPVVRRQRFSVVYVRAIADPTSQPWPR